MNEIHKANIPYLLIAFEKSYGDSYRLCNDDVYEDQRGLINLFREYGATVEKQSFYKFRNHGVNLYKRQVLKPIVINGEILKDENGNDRVEITYETVNDFDKEWKQWTLSGYDHHFRELIEDGEVYGYGFFKLEKHELWALSASIDDLYNILYMGPGLSFHVNYDLLYDRQLTDNRVLMIVRGE